MLIIGAHRINHRGFDSEICRQISASGSLQGSGVFGIGAYAYDADRIPAEYKGDPFVIFQPIARRSEIDITHIYIPGIAASKYQARDTFFFIVRDSGRSLTRLIPVAILGFVDYPGFPLYQGRLYYF